MKRIRLVFAFFEFKHSSFSPQHCHVCSDACQFLSNRYPAKLINASIASPSSDATSTAAKMSAVFPNRLATSTEHAQAGAKCAGHKLAHDRPDHRQPGGDAQARSGHSAGPNGTSA